MYWIIFGVFLLLSFIVQKSLTNKIEKFNKVRVPKGLTGADVARKMLSDNGIYDVTVSHTGGFLTDHYNPKTKTINLSDNVYNSCSIAAAAVAAHECGHAVQHATSYAPLKLRSALVPVLSFSSNITPYLLFGGILFLNRNPYILLAGIICYAISTLFCFITLPVEINASKRAVNWLLSANITDNNTTEMAESALRSAAYTYVINALCSLSTLIYYILIFLDRR